MQTGAATYAWVVLARGAAPHYSASIVWTGTGPYTMTITGATHLRGTDPVVRVKEFISGTNYRVVNLDEVTLDETTGDVVITSSENFTGKITIL